MSKATDAINGWSKSVQLAMMEAAKPQIMRPLGEKAVEIIVRRTRLGYGVERHGQERFKLKALSPGYVYFRKQVDAGLASFPGSLGKQGLSEWTTPTKSNLTATGRMLDSMAGIEVRRGSVVVGPTGGRPGGLTNMQVAAWVSRDRPFNFLSRLEQEQLVRFYRNRVGDLLRNRRLKP